MKPDTPFGNYRLLEVLGQGAMGSVWRAMDLRLEREVALKILKDVDESRRRALLSEAKLASQLNHPNIAHVYEAGEVEGEPFIAMELVEGRTLRTFVGTAADGPWLVSLALQAASALQAAHDKGIIHRDIKPENLVLKADGVLKILDFGIARLQNRSASTGSTGHHATLIERTAPGYSQGTPAYMSPEQANGYELTGGSDQFSLGVVLFELATGVHPFLRANLVETLFAVAKDPVKPLAATRKDLPEAFCAVVDRMLGKMPLDRFESMAECQAALRALEGAHQATTMRAPVLPQTKKTYVMVAGVALGLVALGGGGMWWALRRAGGGGLLEARKAAATDFSKGRKVIAVLPLEQMVPDEALAWLSNSFADAMSTGLMQREDALVVDRLRVQEIFAQLGEVPGKPLKTFGQVSKALKAESIVQGSYVVVQDKIRVSVRVLDAATGQALHQFQVERPKAAMLEIEDELQRRLPAEMGLGATGSGLRSRATNPRTRELFAKANQVLTEGNFDSLQLAKGYYEEALKLEPDYAPAHAGLAWAYQELGATTSLSLGRFEEGQKLFVAARGEAEKAIALDPSVSQAYRALAAALLRQGDVDGASKAALQALRLDPADTLAYGVLADTFAGLEGEENYLAARRYFEKALSLNPDSWQIHHRFAVLLQNNGLLPEAVTHAERAIALRPMAEFAHVTVLDALLWMGKAQEAQARAVVARTLLPASNIIRSLHAIAAADQGDAAAFDAVAQSLKGVWDPKHPNAVLLEGLGKLVHGDKEATKATFKLFLTQAQGVDWSTKRHNEKRVTSLGLYFMGRTMARLGDREAATRMVELADRLHSGKRKVMAVDPAFRN